jgi:hypothetical protein
MSDHGVQVIFAEDIPSRQSHSDEEAEVAAARRDRIQAQQELVDIQRHRLELERSRAYATWQGLGYQQDSARSDLQTAADVGDDRRVALARAEIDRLEGAKEQAREYFNRVSGTPPPVHPDPTARFVANANLTKKSAEWVYSHPEVASDQTKYNAMLSGHHAAVAAGVPIESDQYFDAVERAVYGKSGRDNGGHFHSENRSPGMPSVTLSKSERERATDGSVVWNRGNTDSKGQILKHGDPRIGQPVGVSEYARRKAQMEKDGYYNKS